ncbi:MAG: hypothetical protein U0694_29035 [Anaerolineae bacterium]
MRALTFEFRFIIVAILGVIVPFGAALYLLPTQTEVYWPWVMNDGRSAMMLGAGYLAAVIYYSIALRWNQWLRIKNAYWGLFTFAGVLLFATLLHWDQFRNYYISTLIWLLFYYTGFVLVPIVFRLELLHGGNTDPKMETPKIGEPFRTWMIVRGVFYLVVTVATLLFTQEVANAFPWPIAPIDLQVAVAQVSSIGWMGLMVALNNAWEQNQMGMIFTFFAGVFQLVALVLGPSAYDASKPLALLLPIIFAEWVVTPVVLFAVYRKGE